MVPVSGVEQMSTGRLFNALTAATFNDHLLNFDVLNTSFLLLEKKAALSGH